jgi:polysaccharide deacetylase family protein (PEP-CTERM system associated)
MNILTFDIEEWALAKAGGYGTAEKYAEYDAFLDRILDMLDKRGIKATCFCTGLMAEDFPQVVKLIQSRGHEIGCHSNRHTWMNKMTEAEAREDTHAAVSSLEQCIGQKVLSYRAPAFSIGENNKWMFEILASEGIKNDSSVFPAARDFGGFPAFSSQTPCTIKYAGIELKEYPISMTHFMGKQVAYSGGGYFRFFPLSFVKGRMEKSDYTMCYFHINDLLPEKGGVPSKTEYEKYYREPGTLKNRYMRYIKTNLGKKGSFDKMIKLINSVSFVNIEQAGELFLWEQAVVVTL